MPRSPSRELSDRFTGNRGYFHQPESLRKRKYVFSVVALVAAVGWAAVDVGNAPKSDYSYSHGPLANVHAAWDDNCSACHATHSAAEVGPGSFLHVRDRWRGLTCERCHAGPAHHATSRPKGEQFQNDCSSCHHDHGGRANSLTRISDAHCTSCHKDLAANCTTATVYQNKVTGFATDHPEFRSLKPGTAEHPTRTLKFSHALHMTEGITYVADGKEKLTFDKIKALSGEAAANRYRWGNEKGADSVSLRCESCHKLDSGVGSDEYARLQVGLIAAGEPRKSVLPPRAQGAYYLPVNFEESCRACHPLKAPEAVYGEDKKLIVKGFDVPHRKQPQELEKELMGGYLQGIASSNHPALAAPAEPGGLFHMRPILAARTIRQQAEQWTRTAANRLLKESSGCAKCHDLAGAGVVPVPDHTVWFEHAYFNHASHRGVDCSVCHPNTGGSFAPGGNVVEKEPVQITDVKSCQACHSPRGTPVELPGGERLTGGGIRHDCIDCHRYHNGDHPLQGRGADDRSPRKLNTLPGFLNGR